MANSMYCPFQKLVLPHHRRFESRPRRPRLPTVAYNCLQVKAPASSYRIHVDLHCVNPIPIMPLRTSAGPMNLIIGSEHAVAHHHIYSPPSTLPRQIFYVGVFEPLGYTSTI